jgi:hypothetical protein
VDVNSAKFRDNLAAALWMRFSRTRQQADMVEAADLWRTVSGMPSAAPAVRVRAARSWGRLAAGNADPPSAQTAFATAVRLLPQVVWRGLRRTSQEEQLTRWAGLAADAAAWAIEAGQAKQAVEMLEEGRSVLWSQVLQDRADLTAVRRLAPGLAAELEQLRTRLNRSDDRQQTELPVSPDADAVIDKRMHEARRLDEVLAEVRRLPGHADFLAPKSFEAHRHHLQRLRRTGQRAPRGASRAPCVVE